MAVPDRRAAALPLQALERVQLALPDSRFQFYPGSGGLADRQRRGLPAAPVNVTAAGNRLLLSPAERADIIVDFTYVPLGNHILSNVGPDEPFGGGVPGIDFDVADPATTGQVMQFRVVPVTALDPTTPPQYLVLPPVPPLPAETVTRRLALIEEMSKFFRDTPVEAELGTIEWDAGADVGTWRHFEWMRPVTENPATGATEIWELYNVTADAHPIHIHEVVFEVVNRQDIVMFENRSRCRSIPHHRRRRRSPGRPASRTP